MSCKQKGLPVLCALGVGVIMVTTFLAGQHLLARNHTFIGSVMIVLAVLVWPLYALYVTLGFYLGSKQSFDPERCIEQRAVWRRSIYWVPVGAMLGIQVLDWLIR